MKRIFTLLMVLGLCTSSYAVHTVNWSKQFQDKSEIKNLSPELTDMVLGDFLSMTPKKYKKMTGKKLGFKNTVKMKVAQKMLKKKLRKGGANGKSQLIALLLVALVGVLGIHRFYLGYTTIGIVQLLTLGGCGIWALIDLIRIVTGDLGPKDGSYEETL